MDYTRLIKLDNLPVRLWRELGVLIFISAIGLAIRFPFFFPAVIDWDESTFILVGQSAVNGFLPYEIAWDIKPPFVYWWFGAAIELFGKSIPAVRLAGFIWLALSGYVLYRAAVSITESRLGGIFGVAMLIVATSTYSPYVSTEHLAVLPMAGAILVLQGGLQPLRSIFLAGVLLGFACMFRLNLIFLCFFIGAFLCAQTPRRSWEAFLCGVLKRGASFSVGLLTPAFLSFLPYLLSGHWLLWIRFYEVALSYSDAQRSLAKNTIDTLRASVHSVAGTTMWGAAILGAFIVFRHWSDLSPVRRSNWVLCGVFVLGSFLSIIMTGLVFPHYFTQLAPGLSMFAAAALSPRGKAFGLSKVDLTKFAVGSILIGIAIFRTAAAEWNTLTNRLWAGEPLPYGTAYDIANFIKRQSTTEDFSLFMLDNHLVYWLLDRYPPTLLATQPSNLVKPFIRRYLEADSETTEDAFRSVFLREPTFVVWHPHSWYLDTAATSFLQEELATAYKLVAVIGRDQVFQRKAH